jgi:Uma2 family endonuclease
LSEYKGDEMTLTKSKIEKGEKKVYTYEDYLKLPDDGNRYEILNGELIMTAAPYIPHQRICGKLFIELTNFITKNNIGEVFIAPCDVFFDEKNVYQPDIIFISSENKNIIIEANIKGSPDLLIEIISPSTAYYDLFEKKEIYEKFGVKEYWIIDPQKHWIEIYTLKQNKYSLFSRIEKKGKIKSSLLKKLDIDASKLFKEA